MPQGAVKKSKITAGTSKRSNSAGVKKGRRTIAPKRAVLKEQHKKAKTLNAAMLEKTERSLVGKAGRLEMLGRDKRSKKGVAADSKGKKKG